LDLTDKRVLVVGLGRSGVASAVFLRGKGARVTVTDTKPEAELKQYITQLTDPRITVEAGGHGERTFKDQDLIVVSPGVPTDSPPLAQARAAGVPIIGEIELAAQFLPGPIAAITGANGKTTTTTLAGEIIARDGRPTLVGGNIGTAAISFVGKATAQTWIVLEVSSFQLETIKTFRPRVAAILNITPDHLDRHGTFEAYRDAKARVFENQREDDFTVLNADDATCKQLGSRVHSELYWFSRRSRVTRGAFVQDGQIVWRDHDEQRKIMPVAEIPLKGAHNLENVLAAVAIAVLAGAGTWKLGLTPKGAPVVMEENIRAAVRDFKAVEHRLEYVATIHGVEYYNDSKATNVDATIKALESFPSGIHIILGGKDKGSDYTVLKPLLKQRARRVYTIGAAAEKIESQIAGAAEITRAGTLDNAIHQASEQAAKGEVVVLAPACASFDQFDNYEHRGRVFKELVHKLEKVPSGSAR
jgi:UDP-N-acetylmuramoylalanine--D-glutamate ligase